MRYIVIISIFFSLEASSNYYFIENPGGYVKDREYTECKFDKDNKLKKSVENASKKKVNYMKDKVHKTECMNSEEFANCYLEVEKSSGKPTFFTIYFRKSLYECEYLRAYNQNRDKAKDK